MKLVLDGPQTMLARTATELMSKHDPVDRLRRLRDSGDELGFSPEVWSQMADLGWLGIPISEDQGGLGMGMAEVVLITEAMGRALAPEPFLSSVLCARLLTEAGGDLAEEWLPSLLDGSRRLALAYAEPGTRFDFHRVSARAIKTESGWTLDGVKTPVSDGFRADGWIVSARTAGDFDDHDGIGLFLIPADRAGVRVERLQRIDSCNASANFFDGVLLTADDLVSEQGYQRLEQTLDLATVGLCGEMVGGMNEIYRRTLDYLREREQFGVPIGSFQALQHRAAQLFIEIELARSTVMAAARALDSGAEDASRQVSNAKARCSDAYIQATNEALQMHGGIGMTDEHDVGLFLKRARVSEMTLGDSAYHRSRFARLSGY